MRICSNVHSETGELLRRDAQAINRDFEIEEFYNNFLNWRLIFNACPSWSWTVNIFGVHATQDMSFAVRKKKKLNASKGAKYYLRTISPPSSKTNFQSPKFFHW